MLGWSCLGVFDGGVRLWCYFLFGGEGGWSGGKGRDGWGVGGGLVYVCMY